MSDREPLGRTEAARIPLSKLAFVGDAVFELIIRSHLVTDCAVPFEQINDLKRSFVCAAAQASDAELLMPLLTEDEAAVYRRGRNAKHKNIPKNATGGEYSRATGFEALVGYLWLAGEQPRLEQLIKTIIESKEGVK